VCHTTDAWQMHSVLLPQIQSSIGNGLSHLRETSTKEISLSALRRNNTFVVLSSALPVVRVYHGNC